MPTTTPMAPLEQLQFARNVLRDYAAHLEQMAVQLSASFLDAAERVLGCAGRVVVSGMGKAGYIGQKFSATLASTGAPSYFLHPAEAIHGDLGRIAVGDVAVLFSQSGETAEITRLLGPLMHMETPIIAVTGAPNSTLATSAKVVLPLGDVSEACSLGLAPSTSTIAMLAMGDALALLVSKLRGFGESDFARFHPGGSLGLKLSLVDDHMRPMSECRLADESAPLRQVLASEHCVGRRTGAIMLHDAAGRLTGLFTDSDLARLFERHRESQLDGPVRDVMTRAPLTVPSGAKMTEAVALLARHKISELPVVDESGCPMGLIDITDVVSSYPQLAADQQPRPLARPA